MRALGIHAVSLAAAFAAVAAAIVATAFHLQYDKARSVAAGSVTATSPASDPLATELVRCRAIGLGAEHDGYCEAAWAENRRRFFTYQQPSAQAPAGPAKNVLSPNAEAK